MAARPVPPYMVTLGEEVLRLRRRKGLLQAELAKLAGMSTTTLSNIEKKKLPSITVEHLMALAEHLEASPNILLGQADEMRTRKAKRPHDEPADAA